MVVALKHKLIPGTSSIFVAAYPIGTLVSRRYVYNLYCHKFFVLGVDYKTELDRLAVFHKLLSMYNDITYQLTASNTWHKYANEQLLEIDILHFMCCVIAKTQNLYDPSRNIEFKYTSLSMQGVDWLNHIRRKWSLEVGGTVGRRN